jgi:predicted transcriptional regulator/DNA-binding XRE family transcriptional regulator
LGPRIRALRQARALSQVELARQLEISASYLNLIEHNQRALTPEILVRLARGLEVDLAELDRAPDDDLFDALTQVFADPDVTPDRVPTADVRELAEQMPTVAHAIIGMHRALTNARTAADRLAARIYDDEQGQGTPASSAPSEEVTDYLQRQGNHFPELEQLAERLWRDARLVEGDVARGLVRHLADRHGVRVEDQRPAGPGGMLRHFDPTRRVVTLSTALPPASRTFQLAVQVGLFLGHLGPPEPHMGSEAAQRLLRVVLANYFAAAVMMPYEDIQRAADSERHDLEILSHRFHASFEQVCHRLTTLRRPGAEGVPFHLLRVDMAGNISKRFSGSGIGFARFAGACPRWNVFNAFLTPGSLRVQVSEMPDGTRYFCVARTVHRGRAGYHGAPSVQAIGLGCEIAHARRIVYADGIDLEDRRVIVPVGVTCRLCERADCEQRAFPSIRQPVLLDENRRVAGAYVAAGHDDR